MTTAYDSVIEASSDATASIDASQRPLRVLMLLTSTAGGVGQHSYMLAQHLSRERFDLTVAFGPGYPLDEAFDTLRGCHIVHLSTRRSISPIANLRAMWQVFRLMRQGEFDIVFTAQSIAGFVGRVVAVLAGIPVRLHCIHVYACHDDQPAWKRWIYRMIERRLDGLTTRYVAVSEATKRFGVERGLFAEHRVHVIPNGVPEPVDASDSRDAIRAELGIKPDALLCMTASRFEPQKGLDLLIEAMSLVAAWLPDAQLVLVGEGPLRTSLEQRVQKLGLQSRILFAGWRSDIQRILPAADLFVLSSLWEAMPLTIVEAMAAGRAVVATDVGGVREMVIDGQTGSVVPPRNVQALADAMLRLLRDPATRQQFGKAARERYLKHFTLPRMVQRFDQVLWESVQRK